MIFEEERRIAREVHIDDGTTCGKTVYRDNYGDYWEPTHMTRENHGTADIIATIDRGKIVL